MLVVSRLVILTAYGPIRNGKSFPVSRLHYESRKQSKYERWWQVTSHKHSSASKARHHAASRSFKPVSAKIYCLSAVNSLTLLRMIRTVCVIFLILFFFAQTEATRGRRRGRGSHRRPQPEIMPINSQYFNCVHHYPCPDDVSLETCRHEAVRDCSTKYRK